MIKESKTINILGARVQIDFRKEQDDRKLENCVGYYDSSVNRIVVKVIEPDALTKEDIESYQKEIIRHEVIHAFLHESGLDACSGPAENWATCEEMVDWFAIQSPKILKVFLALEVM